VPPLREVVERCDHPGERFLVDSRCREALVPVVGERRPAPARAPRTREDAGEQLRPAAPRATSSQPLATPHRRGHELLVDRPEGARVAACRELAEDGAVEPPLGLGHEVEQVVRQELVEPGRGVHDECAGRVALDEDAVAPRAGLPELDDHDPDDTRPMLRA
jgi:hypothetical protein